MFFQKHDGSSRRKTKTLEDKESGSLQGRSMCEIFIISVEQRRSSVQFSENHQVLELTPDLF